MGEDIEDIVYKAKSGDKESKKFIIEYSDKYLEKILSYFCRNNRILSREDLKQDGVIAIIKAINTYNKDKNVRFSTYVYNLIQYTLMSQIKNKYTFIKIPEHKVSKVVAFKKEREDLKNMGYSDEVICCKMKMSLDKYKHMIKLINLSSVLSLNSELSKDKKTEFVENLMYEDANYRRIEDRLYLEFLKEEIKGKLTDLEKSILIKSILRNKSIKSISQEINMSPKKVSELKYSALKKIRIKQIQS